MKSKQVTLGVLAVLAILAVAIIMPSLHIVRTEDAAVVRVWGVVDRVIPPGLNFVFWIPNTVDRFSLQVREQTFAFSAYSIDAQNISGYITVLYRLNPTPASIKTVAEEFVSLDNLESRIDGVFMEEIQNVFALKTALQIVEQRAILSGEIRERLSGVMGQFHVIVDNVAVESIQFSRAFEQAVEDRMITEQARMRAEEERDIALIVADQQLQVAGLEAQAVVVAAEADARALEIMQDAWGDLGAEVRDIMLRQLLINSWDGIMPRVVGGGAGEMQFIIDAMGITD